MADGIAIALRFGTYLDLLLLFGLAAHAIHAPPPAPPAARRAILIVLAMLGLILSVAALLVTTAAMAGIPVNELDWTTLRSVMVDTALGTAFLVRIAALCGVAAVAGFIKPRPAGDWIIAGLSAAALASLAWAGHAAMSEGMEGTIHLVADIVHLLAAGAWIGALAMLMRALLAPINDRTAMAAAERALTGFARAGSIIVALMLVTGLINSWIIVGPENLALLPAVLYGQLLIAKLMLFAAMLALAAANRWRLTPRLQSALADGDTARAARALRMSITAEASAAVVILALVAWLGTLAPPSSM